MKYIHRLLLVPTILAASGLLTPSVSYAVVKPTPSGGSTAGGKSDPFFETEIILKEVVQSGPVVQ